MLKLRITKSEKAEAMPKVDMKGNSNEIAEMLLYAMIDSPDLIDVISKAVKKYQEIEF